MSKKLCAHISVQIGYISIAEATQLLQGVEKKMLAKLQSAFIPVEYTELACEIFRDIAIKELSALAKSKIETSITTELQPGEKFYGYDS